MNHEDHKPEVNRRAFSVVDLDDKDEGMAYYKSLTPLERLAALELNRQVAYGYTPLTARFQRVFEIADLGDG